MEGNKKRLYSFVVQRLCTKAYSVSNQDKSNANALIGAVAIWFVLTMGSGIFNLIKLSKAKKILNTYAEKHALPQKELFKEFKKNLKHIRSL